MLFKKKRFCFVTLLLLLCSLLISLDVSTQTTLPAPPPGAVDKARAMRAGGVPMNRQELLQRWREKQSGNTTAPGTPVQGPVRPQVHGELDLVLIDDRVGGEQYLSTLDSRGDTLPGAWPQAIFGARMAGGGAKRPAIWYTYRGDPNVVEVKDFLPKPAFRGLADARGGVQALSGQAFKPQRAEQVNPVLSEQAFQAIEHADHAASRDLSFSERFADGQTRHWRVSVRKTAQLILERPSMPICRDETVQGVAGKRCVLRVVRGTQAAASAGDMRFVVRARFATPQSRFRVGEAWHPLGDSVSLAEFAKARAIEVFFVPPGREQAQAWLAAHREAKMQDLIEADFYSTTRLARGDAFRLRLPDQFSAVQGARQQVARLPVLVIDDQVSGRQYVSSLSEGAEQSLYGEHHPQAGSQALIWHLGASANPDSLPEPDRVSPLFAGYADAQGQISPLQTTAHPGRVHPALNEAAWSSWLNQAVGAQQMLTQTIKQADGQTVRYLAHGVKAAALTLRAPSQPVCHEETVEEQPGRVCVLREVSGDHQAQAAGALRFTVKGALEGARFRVGKTWHPLNETVSLNEFVGAKAIEVFYPTTTAVSPEPVTANREAGMYFMGETEQDVFRLYEGGRRWHRGRMIPTRYRVSVVVIPIKRVTRLQFI